MSGCLDKFHCRCGWLDPAVDWLRQKRNMLASIISGTLFAVGWWCVIDASAESSQPLYAAFHVCGIFSTIALLMINAVSTGQVTGDMYTDGCFGKKGARAWLFVGFVFAFGGLIGSLWILVQEFLVPAVSDDCTTSNNGNTTVVQTYTSSEKSSDDCAHWWQGIAFFLQNLLIFISSLIFKFGRTEEESYLLIGCTVTQIFRILYNV